MKNSPNTSPSQRTLRCRLGTAGFCALLIATACGSSASDIGSDVSTNETTSTSPDTIAAATATTTSPATSVANTSTVEPTERIIPLDGDVAEIVFALGYGDQVVATDLSATYPPEADALPQIGYQRSLSAEPILKFEPTLLIGTDIAGPPETLDDLRRVGLPVEIVPSPATPDGPAIKIQAVADVLGIPEVGADLAAATQAAIDANTVGPAGTGPLTVGLYVRGTDVTLVLGTDFSLGWLIPAAGGRNVADQLGIAETTPVTAETIIAAAPEAILLTTTGLESIGGLDGLAEIPGVARTPAFEHGHIFAYPDQYMLGNGPRTGDFLADLAADLASVEGAP